MGSYDFLLIDSNKKVVYIVELKTGNLLNTDQLKNYINIAKSSKRLPHIFDNIKSKTENGKYGQTFEVLWQRIGIIPDEDFKVRIVYICPEKMINKIKNAVGEEI